MTNIRRLMGLPRFPLRVYLLILALLLILAYTITGPAHQFFVNLRSSMGTFYEPKDLQREEYLKTIEEKKQ